MKALYLSGHLMERFRDKHNDLQILFIELKKAYVKIFGEVL